MTEKKRATFEKPLVKVLCFRLGIASSDTKEIQRADLYDGIINAWCVCNDKNCRDGGVSVSAEIIEGVVTTKNGKSMSEDDKLIAIEGMAHFTHDNEDDYIKSVLNICTMLKEHLKMHELAMEFFYQESQIFLV